MKLCPKCQNPAKPSSSYPGMFVCKCLGFLEDITLIKTEEKENLLTTSELLYGQVSYVPAKKEILGNITCTKGHIYHFDRDLYPFSLGAFVCFKATTWYTNESMSVQGAVELEPLPHLD